MKMEDLKQGGLWPLELYLDISRSWFRFEVHPRYLQSNYYN
jgi:hypothetical protein